MLFDRLRDQRTGELEGLRQDLGGRIDRVESRMREGLAGTRDEMQAMEARIDKRLDRVEGAIEAIRRLIEGRPGDRAGASEG